MKNSKRNYNLTGERRGMLLVLEKTNIKGKDGCYKYKCLCDCGKETILTAQTLNLKYHTRSCGCLRTKSSENRRRPWGVSAFENLYHRYKRNAGLREFEFLITLDEFGELTSKNCYYCGVPPSKTFQNRTNFGGYTYNGIDRLDNSIGYIKENCVPCCSKCNIAKGTLSVFDFLDLIERIHRFQCGL